LPLLPILGGGGIVVLSLLAVSLSVGPAKPRLAGLLRLSLARDKGAQLGSRWSARTPQRATDCRDREKPASHRGER